MTSVVTTTTTTSDENKNNCEGESFKYQEIVGRNNHINIWEYMIDIVKQINSISNLYRELRDFINTNKSIWPTASTEEKKNLKDTRSQMKWQIDLQNCLETDIHFNDKGDTNQVYHGENITLKKKEAMVFRDKLVRFLYEKYKTRKTEVEEKINEKKNKKTVDARKDFNKEQLIEEINKRGRYEKYQVFLKKATEEGQTNEEQILRKFLNKDDLKVDYENWPLYRIEEEIKSNGLEGVNINVSDEDKKALLIKKLDASYRATHPEPLAINNMSVYGLEIEGNYIADKDIISYIQIHIDNEQENMKDDGRTELYPSMGQRKTSVEDKKIETWINTLLNIFNNPGSGSSVREDKGTKLGKIKSYLETFDITDRQKLANHILLRMHEKNFQQESLWRDVTTSIYQINDMDSLKKYTKYLNPEDIFKPAKRSGPSKKRPPSILIPKDGDVKMDRTTSKGSLGTNFNTNITPSSLNIQSVSSRASMDAFDKLQDITDNFDTTNFEPGWKVRLESPTFAPASFTRSISNTIEDEKFGQAFFLNDDNVETDKFAEFFMDESLTEAPEDMVDCDFNLMKKTGQDRICPICKNDPNNKGTLMGCVLRSRIQLAEHLKHIHPDVTEEEINRIIEEKKTITTPERPKKTPTKDDKKKSPSTQHRKAKRKKGEKFNPDVKRRGDIRIRRGSLDMNVDDDTNFPPKTGPPNTGGSKKNKRKRKRTRNKRRRRKRRKRTKKKRKRKKKTR